MKASKKIVELAEKIKRYRTDTKLLEELKTKKRASEDQIQELEKDIKILKLGRIKQNELINQIKKLEEEKKNLKLDMEKLKEAHTFIVTTPNEASDTVYGEISGVLSRAQQEVLICSPWITYIVEELSDSDIGKDKKKTNIKIITRLIKEDVERGITDLDTLRALKDRFGAEIRYNNDLHAKMIIVDNSVAVLSSANLTKKGLSVNYEAGICLRNKVVVKKVAHFFDEIWDESKPLTEEAINDILPEER